MAAAMTAKQIRVRKVFESENFYTGFEQLDGRHPWMTAVPEGYVSYRVRELRQGKVAYFNFFLAKEMGLIPHDHPHEMNSDLEQKLLSTFSLQIINEYDELTKRRIDPETVKPHPYMATRYLQLQHANKQGKTSGDGRGIWNGTVSSRGLTWDVSSRGTGVTCLAPGAVVANRPLKTGSTDFGYGCGQAEIDELLGSAILAESMHLQGVPTERVLCIIDLGKGVGIGVRAAQNLIRPAHLFLYLKQERRDALKAAADYLIERQVKNRHWTLSTKGAAKYEEMCHLLCASFADFTAKLDMDYIFAWLDWDGDNVLADAGIIDYGSVRQFGLRHDRYRYDDIERFSTNLNEQRQKAKLIVQVFVQMADYLKTGEKKSLKSYAKHPVIMRFDVLFKERRAHRLLYRIGFSEEQRTRILSEHRDLFERFDRLYSVFERAKVSGSPQRVADGINHPALYNVRRILRALPEYYLKSKRPLQEVSMDESEFHSLMLSSFAKTKDLRMGGKHKMQIQKFQELYKALLSAAAGSRKPESILPSFSERAQKLNSDQRITGN
ncbi:MAG TPA: hypothetical protein PL182_10095, partial [Pseudobdellovibrionaceae bacterium]|nr:hypothetical protein [Pseudobdellovibrionaceae bacterium]